MSPSHPRLMRIGPANTEKAYAGQFLDQPGGALCHVPVERG